jgi:hypothetical protein
MDEKPRRRFRFGLISLFVLIAAVGVVACFWNPFPKPKKPNKLNVYLIEEGMTEAEVKALVGQPDGVYWPDPRGQGGSHIYEIIPGQKDYAVVYEDGKVLGVLHRPPQPID